MLKGILWEIPKSIWNRKLQIQSLYKAQLVKNPPAVWGTWVQSLDQEDPLEKGRASPSSILAWRIRWIIVHGIAKSRTHLINFHFHFSLFLYSSLCDIMDYTVHGILQARILKWVISPFSRGSSQPRYWTQVSHMAGGFFTSWATREAQRIQKMTRKDKEK